MINTMKNPNLARVGKQNGMFGTHGRMVGAANPLWQSSPSYQALHKWVICHLGQPVICERCGKTATGHGMHWANISGQYRRALDDWVRLCAKCHYLYDKQNGRDRKSGRFAKAVN